MQVIFNLGWDMVFGYDAKYGEKIVLPLLSDLNDERFNWIIVSLNHEYLHLIVFKEIDLAACLKLDGLGYRDIACGNIDGFVKVWW